MSSQRFNTPIERRGTSSLKWDRYDNPDILPMWVADMDFQSPPEVISALKQRAEHGIFGYTNPPDSLKEAIEDRCQSLYNWPVQREWLDWLPGLVCALNICVRAFASEQETVLVPTPVYYPFLTAPGLGHRNMVQSFWKDNNGHWELDWDDLEASITPNTRLFMLCNPQNPNGRVLTRGELEQLDKICQKHNLIVCSDEVHCDLILDGSQHIPYASVSDYAREHSVTLMSPSKTFNLAGLGFAYAVIPNPDLRRRFQKTRKGIVPDPDNMLMGFTAAEAAYRHGESWRKELLQHLGSQHDYLYQSLKDIPQLTMRRHQATYLAWIHCDLSQHLQNKEHPWDFFERAGLGLSPGKPFGDEQYVRLNFACTRAQLELAVERVKTALS